MGRTNSWRVESRPSATAGITASPPSTTIIVLFLHRRRFVEGHHCRRHAYQLGVLFGHAQSRVLADRPRQFRAGQVAQVPMVLRSFLVTLSARNQSPVAATLSSAASWRVRARVWADGSSSRIIDALSEKVYAHRLRGPSLGGRRPMERGYVVRFGQVRFLRRMRSFQGDAGDGAQRTTHTTANTCSVHHQQ